MSSSVYFDNEKKDILFLGKGPTQGLDQSSVNFFVTRNKFCVSLHYNGANSYLFVNGTRIIKFKAK